MRPRHCLQLPAHAILPVAPAFLVGLPTILPPESTEKGSEESKVANRNQAPRLFQIVDFTSNGFSLHGALWKPIGPCPIPPGVYNHGSEQRLAESAQVSRIRGNLCRLK